MLTQLEVQTLANELGVDFDVVSFDEFERGIVVEREHTDDVRLAARIALDHLRELPDYYTRLAIAESSEGRFAAIGKSQWIRVLDVLLIGPLMVWGAFALGRTRHSFSALLLGSAGVLTIGYNAWHFAKVREVLRVAAQPVTLQSSSLDRGGLGQGPNGGRASGRRSSFVRPVYRV